MANILILAPIKNLLLNQSGVTWDFGFDFYISNDYNKLDRLISNTEQFIHLHGWINYSLLKNESYPYVFIEIQNTNNAQQLDAILEEQSNNLNSILSRVWFLKDFGVNSPTNFLFTEINGRYYGRVNYKDYFYTPASGIRISYKIGETIFPKLIGKYLEENVLLGRTVSTPNFRQL